jgi:hypothetical protein
MFGQAPYIVNGLISYTNDKWGFSTGLSYNVQGPKLVITTAREDAPDIYELPFHALDFKASKSLSDKITLELKVRNILNSSITRAFDGDGISSPSWSRDSEGERVKNLLSSLFSKDKHYEFNIPFDSYFFGPTVSLSLGFSL